MGSNLVRKVREVNDQGSRVGNNLPPPVAQYLGGWFDQSTMLEYWQGIRGLCVGSGLVEGATGKGESCALFPPSPLYL